MSSWSIWPSKSFLYAGALMAAFAVVFACGGTETIVVEKEVIKEVPVETIVEKEVV